MDSEMPCFECEHDILRDVSHVITHLFAWLHLTGFVLVILPDTHKPSPAELGDSNAAFVVVGKLHGGRVSQLAGLDRMSHESLRPTSQNVLPSASTAAPPLELDSEAFFETLAGLSSPESSLTTKLLRRLPIVDL